MLRYGFGFRPVSLLNIKALLTRKNGNMMAKEEPWPSGRENQMVVTVIVANAQESKSLSKHD